MSAKPQGPSQKGSAPGWWSVGEVLVRRLGGANFPGAISWQGLPGSPHPGTTTRTPDAQPR